MSTHESAVVFECAGDVLLGLLTHPARQAKETGVLIVVGGPQYRAGSHRQFLLLARALAAEAYVVMRFDCRGMGDSSGEAPGFAALDSDIAAAMDALQQSCPAVQRIVLWGLCDGASAAVLYAQRSGDQRIAGLVLANPWLHTPQAEAHAVVHTYYWQRLRNGAFWRKLLHGGMNPLSKLRELADHWQRARVPTGETAYASLMLAALRDLPQPMLLLLCQRDATAQEFLAQLALARSDFLRRPQLERRDFAWADHTFSRALWRREVEAATSAWLNQYFPTAGTESAAQSTTQST